MEPTRGARIGQGSNSVQVRQYNERIVLQALRRLGEASKADIARVAGLTNNAVGAIVADLAADGLVRELGKQHVGRRGQPATILALEPRGAFSIGVRLDRVGIEMVCVDFSGRIIAERVHDCLLPPPDAVLEMVVQDIASIVEEIGPERRAHLAGVGVAQPYNLGSWLRELELPTNSFKLWDEIDFSGALSRATGLPVFPENDGNAAAIAELFYGLGRQIDDYVYVFIGGAVGGGIVLASDCLRGAGGNAGDIAMLPVPASRLGSAPAPAHAFDVLLTRASLATLRRHLRWNGIDAGTLGDLARQFDAVPRPAAVDEWIDDAVAAFVPALYAAAAVLDIGTVILECDLECDLVDTIIARLEPELARAAPESVQVPKLRRGSFGARAGAIGAATLPLFFNFSPRSSILTGAAAVTREAHEHAAAH